MIKAEEYSQRREMLLSKLDNGSIAILFAGVGRKRSADENYVLSCCL